MRVVRGDVTAGWFITVTDEYGGVHEVHPLNGVGSWGSQAEAMLATIADRWPHLAAAVGRIEILPSTAEEDDICQRRYGCTPAELIARMGGE